MVEPKGFQGPSTASQTETRVAGAASALPLLRLIELAMWFGAIAGVAQVALGAILEPFADRPGPYGPHQVWMAPLTTSLMLGIGALPLGLAALGAPSPLRFRFQIAGLLVPALWSLALLFPQIEDWASLTLCAGVALKVSDVLAKRHISLLKWSRRSLPAMAGLLAATGFGITASRIRHERGSIAGIAPAATSRPNILLIVLDTERAMSLDLYGAKRPTTPWLSRFATSGTVFDWAIAPAPWTLPSHASMLTGRFPHELSAELGEPLDRAAPTLAERLAAAGYHTVGIVANTAYGTRTFGLDRGFGHYDDLPVSLPEILLNSTLAVRIVNAQKLRAMVGWYDNVARRTAPEITESFSRWLDRPRDRPFFAFLNLFDVHDPYLPPAPFDTAFGASNRRDLRRLSWSVRGANLWNFFQPDTPPDLIAAELRSYDASIAYLDSQLQNLFQALEARGILDETLVIITSDHGEAFGEQVGVFRHGTSLLMPQIHVPLVVRWPGVVAPGRRVSTPVSLRDLPATILDLSGVQGVERLPGSSLAWALKGGQHDGSEAPHPPAISNLRKLGDQVYYSVTQGTHHYIRKVDRSTGATLAEELYDLATDPITETDIVRRAVAGSILPALRRALDSTLSKSPPIARRAVSQ